MAKSEKSSAPRKSAAKKSPEPQAKRRRASRSRKGRNAPQLHFVPKLPERFEQVALLKRAVAELEKREGDLNEAFERVQDGYQDLVGRLGGLQEKTRGRAGRRVDELFTLVRGSKAGEALEDLPDRAKDELDELLDRVGLMRKQRHEELLEKAKKRAKTAGKRAAKKDLEKAAEQAEG